MHIIEKESALTKERFLCQMIVYSQWTSDSGARKILDPLPEWNLEFEYLALTTRYINWRKEDPWDAEKEKEEKKGDPAKGALQ